MTIVSMNYLLEAGVHFGHQKRRWNPKMKEYIYTTRDDIYIIDLQKTVKKLEEAYDALKEIAAAGGKILFVGTNKQAQESAEENAVRTNMYFVNERWLGGTLTNFKTIRSRIKRMDEIDKMEEDGTFDLLPKKEVIKIRKEYDKLNKNLRGIREMKKIPQALVIVDPRKEENAIKEAHILGIPVFGIVDTNCDPDLVDYVIPGNDDAVRSVKLIIGALTNAIAEVNGNEIIDYVTEEDKNRSDTKKGVKRDQNIKEVKDDLKNLGDDLKKVADKVQKAAKEEIAEKKEEIASKTEEVKKEVKKAVKEVAEEVAKKMSDEDLSNLTLAELKTRAKDAGVKGYSTMKKQELVDVLSK